MIAKFTLSQYQQILDLLKKSESKNEHSANNTCANACLSTGISCSVSLNKFTWIIDNGASNHMCHSLEKFCQL